MPIDHTDFTSGFTFTMCVKNKADAGGLFVVREEFTLYFDKKKENYELFTVESSARAKGVYNNFDFILDEEPSPDDPSQTRTTGLVGGTDTTVSVVKRNAGDRIVSEAGDQYLHIDGGFIRFESLWLDGELLKRSTSNAPGSRDGDYYAEDGSTRVTVFDQTVSDLSEGEHTVSAAFVDNSLEDVNDSEWGTEYSDMDNTPGSSDLGTASQNFTVEIEDNSSPLAGGAASDGRLPLGDIPGISATDSGVGTPVEGSSLTSPELHPNKGFFHVRGSGKSFMLDFSLPNGEFIELLMDGDKIGADNYFKQSKSNTVIEIMPEFLATYNTGEHALTAVFLGGTIHIKFMLDPNDAFLAGLGVEGAGSGGPPLLLIIVIIAAAAIGGAVVIGIRKKKAAQTE